MNRMMRSSAIYGGLLAGLLVASWMNYTADPEMELDGKVILVAGEVEDLTKVTWTSKNKDEAIVERKTDAVGTYYDVQYTRWTEVKVPEPPPQLDPEVPEGPKTPEDAAEDGDAPAEAEGDGATDEVVPVEPEPEYEVSVTHFKAGDKGVELFESLAPMLALRALEDMTPENIETTGLDDPQDALIIERKGKVIRLDVGGEVYGTRDRYVREPDSGAVYLVDDELLRPLRYARTRLPDRTLWSFETKRIASISVGGPEGSIELVQKNAEDAEKATWVMKDTPDEAGEQIKTWMSKALRMKSTAYASDDDDIEGIELVFSLTLTDEKGETQTLEVLQKPGEERAHFWGRSEHTRGLVKLLRGQTTQLADDVGAIVSSGSSAAE
jgi:hypothetical protein